VLDVIAFMLVANLNRRALRRHLDRGDRRRLAIPAPRTKLLARRLAATRRTVGPLESQAESRSGRRDGLMVGLANPVTSAGPSIMSTSHVLTRAITRGALSPDKTEPGKRIAVRQVPAHSMAALIGGAPWPTRHGSRPVGSAGLAVVWLSGVAGDTHDRLSECRHSLKASKAWSRRSLGQGRSFPRPRQRSLHRRQRAPPEPQSWSHPMARARLSQPSERFDGARRSAARRRSVSSWWIAHRGLERSHAREHPAKVGLRSAR
jgi:hypothetical protein